MPIQFKSWISAARPKTLALATAGPLVGIALTIYKDYSLNKVSALLCLAVAIILQVLSNFANDLGDYQKGTDQRANRTDRALTSGAITESQMKIAVILTAIVGLATGLGLLYTAQLSLRETLILFGIGMGAIISAIAYTVGKKAYGYHGFGDLFVFIFFGLVSVMATYYILAHSISFEAILGAIAVGCFSTMVLNINNIRDIKKDSISNKRTIPVIIGFHKSRIYHILLAAISSFCWAILIFTYNAPYLAIPLFPLILVLQTFLNIKPDEFEAFNKQLKFTSLLTLLFALVLFISATLTSF